MTQRIQKDIKMSSSCASFSTLLLCPLRPEDEAGERYVSFVFFFVFFFAGLFARSIVLRSVPVRDFTGVVADVTEDDDERRRGALF